MLEHEGHDEDHKDKESAEWVFRPDKQFKDELKRMRAFKLSPSKGLDYRLNHKPFYFKFVKRIERDLRNAGLIISLDHLGRVIASPESAGKRGGRRINYKMLGGRYLRKMDIVGLVQSGYIGTTYNDTKTVTEIIRMSLESPERTSIVAYQRLMADGQDDDRYEGRG